MVSVPETRRRHGKSLFCLRITQYKGWVSKQSQAIGHSGSKFTLNVVGWSGGVVKIFKYKVCSRKWQPVVTFNSLIPSLSDLLGSSLILLFHFVRGLFIDRRRLFLFSAYVQLHQVFNGSLHFCIQNLLPRAQLFNSLFCSRSFSISRYLFLLWIHGAMGQQSESVHFGARLTVLKTNSV